MEGLQRGKNTSKLIGVVLFWLLLQAIKPGFNVSYHNSDILTTSLMATYYDLNEPLGEVYNQSLKE